MYEQMPTYKELMAYWELTHNDHEQEHKEWIRKQDEKIKEDLLGNGSFLYAGVNLPKKYESVINQIVSASKIAAQEQVKQEVERSLLRYFSRLILVKVSLFAILAIVLFIWR